MYIINTVDSDQYGYINYMEYDILRKQMMKPTPTQNYIYITKNRNMYLKNYIQISFTCQILSILFKHIKILKGAHGVEPWTSRSAVECSTTELYPLMIKQVSMRLEILKLLFSSFFLTFKWQCQVQKWHVIKWVTSVYIQVKHERKIYAFLQQ